MFKRLQTGILSLGAFSLGIYFEKYKLDADVNVVPTTGGDIPDGITLDASSNKIKTISRYGYPSFDSIRSYPNFVISYDRRNRVPNWVLEHITKENLISDSYDRSEIEFFEDKSFHNFFRATNIDYRKSGYDRGHMAAAGNYRSNPEHMKNTFVLSNIAPQVGFGFNRHKWNELEKYTRKKVFETGQVWVCTGPLYLPQRDPSTGKKFISYEVIGKNHISVPTHFFKLILFEINGKYHLESFLLPNQEIDQKKNLKDFRIDPEVIERASGLLFFNNIARRNILINSK